MPLLVLLLLHALCNVASSASFLRNATVSPLAGTGRTWNDSITLPYERYRRFQGLQSIPAPSDGILFNFGASLDPAETTYSGWDNPAVHIAFTSLAYNATYDPYFVAVGFIEFLFSHEGISIYRHRDAANKNTRALISNVPLPPTLPNINQDSPVYYWIYQKNKSFFVGSGIYPAKNVLEFIQLQTSGSKPPPTPTARDGLLYAWTEGALLSWTTRDIVLGSFSSNPVYFHNMHVLETVPQTRLDALNVRAKLQIGAFCEGRLWLWLNNVPYYTEWPNLQLQGAGFVSLDVDYDSTHLLAMSCAFADYSWGAGLALGVMLDDKPVLYTGQSPSQIKWTQYAPETSTAWRTDLSYDDSTWTDPSLCPRYGRDAIFNPALKNANLTWTNCGQNQTSIFARMNYRTKVPPAAFTTAPGYLGDSSFDSTIPSPSRFLLHYALILNTGAGLTFAAKFKSAHLQLAFDTEHVSLFKSASVYARFVRVERKNPAGEIGIQDISVYDDTGAKITRYLAASSSSLRIGGAEAYKIIDTEPGGGGALTWNYEPTQWMEVDLGKEQLVSRVVITRATPWGMAPSVFSLLDDQRREMTRKSITDTAAAVHTFDFGSRTSLAQRPHNLDFSGPQKQDLWTLVRDGAVIVGTGNKPRPETVAYLLGAGNAPWTREVVNGLADFSDVFMWYVDEERTIPSEFDRIGFKFGDALMDQFSDINWLNPLDQLYEMPFTFNCSSIKTFADQPYNALSALQLESSADVALLVSGVSASDVTAAYLSSSGSTLRNATAANVLELGGASPRLSQATIKNRNQGEYTAVNCSSIALPDTATGCQAVDPWRITLKLSSKYAGSRIASCNVRVYPVTAAPSLSQSLVQYSATVPSSNTTAEIVFQPSDFAVADADSPSSEIIYRILPSSTFNFGALSVGPANFTHQQVIDSAVRYTSGNIAEHSVTKVDRVFYELCSVCTRNAAVPESRDFCADSFYSSQHSCIGPYEIRISINVLEAPTTASELATAEAAPSATSSTFSSQITSATLTTPGTTLGETASTLSAAQSTTVPRTSTLSPAKTTPSTQSTLSTSETAATPTSEETPTGDISGQQLVIITSSAGAGALLIAAAATAAVIIRRHRRDAALKKQQSEMAPYLQSQAFLSANSSAPTTGSATVGMRSTLFTTSPANFALAVPLSLVVKYGEEFIDQKRNTVLATGGMAVIREITIINKAILTRRALSKPNAATHVAKFVDERRTSVESFKFEVATMNAIQTFTNKTVSLLGWSENPMCILMERYDVSLNNLIYSKQGGLSVVHVFKIMRDISEVLGVCERLNIVHNDLKPGNVLVNVTETGFTCFLNDYGCAQYIGETTAVVNGLKNGVAGFTPEYAAPELIFPVADTTITSKSDVYSFSVIIYEALFLKCIFRGKMARDIYNALQFGVQLPAGKAEIKKRRSENSKLFAALHDELFVPGFQLEPEKRPSFKDVISVFRNHGEV